MTSDAQRAGAVERAREHVVIDRLLPTGSGSPVIED